MYTNWAVVKRTSQVLRLFDSSVSYIVYLHTNVLLLGKPSDEQTDGRTDRQTDKRLHKPSKLCLSVNNALIYTQAM
jgi:hypothetical protein